MARYLSTAYGPPWEGIQGTGVTASGIDLRPAKHAYIIAADLKRLPMHTKVTVSPNPFASVVVFSVEDTGSAIVGAHIDFYDWRGRKYQLDWGTRWVDVEVVGDIRGPVQPAPVTSGPGALPTHPPLEGAPGSGAQTAYDYSHVIRSARVNVQRSGAYLRDAGDALRRLTR